MDTLKSTFADIQEFKSQVGNEIGISDWLTIDQQMINQFGSLTKDEQWIHVDPAKAAESSPFKTPIAHGFLILSMFSHLYANCIALKGAKMGINYGFDKVRFTNAVTVNAKIRGRFKLLQLELKESAARYKYGVTVEIEGQEKPACIAEWVCLAYV